MKWLHMAAYILLIVGGLNWLLLAITGWEIGSLVGGMGSMVAQAIYVLVGLSAIYIIFTHKKYCKDCASGMGM